MAMTLTIQDVIRWIQEDPEAKEELRRILLTEELLNLPQKFAELVEMTRRNSRAIEQNSRAIEQNSRAIDRLVNASERRDRDIGMLKGLALDASLQGNAISFLSGRFRLRRGTVMRGPTMYEINHEFEDAVYDANLEGIITESQRNRILDTDLIAWARDSAANETVYVAVEASFTIEEDDIARVNETADSLRKVFPSNRVMAVVYGSNINDKDAEFARNQSVETVIAEFPR